MPKYEIKLSWGKHIDFPVIKANSKEEAQAHAENMLAEENNNLYEEDDRVENWDIEEIK